MSKSIPWRACIALSLLAMLAACGGSGGSDASGAGSATASSAPSSSKPEDKSASPLSAKSSDSEVRFAP
ncbi:hypothetical protein [Variovorax soli]|uniref:hypothetical protein n=1 Tax=Variovorax soli TaxID=376815 RepID=UPI000AAEC33E|nr:hypothetical protein [Variovorax soli]